MLTIDPQPVSDRHFYGLGAQADGYLYDELNAKFHLTDADYELNEHRLDHLQLAVTRMFVHLEWFNPSLDGVSFDWEDVDFGHFCRQLRRHHANGALAALVLFHPSRPTAKQIPNLIQAMVAMIKRLITKEGLDNIRWLTLWNEPESAFPHDSPLVRRLFGDDAIAERSSWDDYVRAHRIAQDELVAAGLADQVQLLTPDCVWGAPLRVERMKLAVEEFGADDVAFCYHNYSSEDPSFYDDNPDWAYPGMAAEAAAFRDLVGPDKPLLLTEFNVAGDAMSSRFAGCGRGGVALAETIEGAVIVADKVLKAAANGVDGIMLWCLQDMWFCKQLSLGEMNDGLWRFKGANWTPRPLFHYYAALIQALRPGIALHRIDGTEDSITALAARQRDRQVVILLNTSTEAIDCTIQLDPGTWQRRRVYRDILPTNAELPHADEEDVEAQGALNLQLEPEELTILETNR